MIELWTAYKRNLEKLASAPAFVHKSKRHLFESFKPSSAQRSKRITKFNQNKKLTPSQVNL